MTTGETKISRVESTKAGEESTMTSVVLQQATDLTGWDHARLWEDWDAARDTLAETLTADEIAVVRQGLERWHAGKPFHAGTTWPGELVEALRVYPGLGSIHVHECWSPLPGSISHARLETASVRTRVMVDPDDLRRVRYLAQGILENEVYVLEFGGESFDLEMARAGLRLLQGEI